MRERMRALRILAASDMAAGEAYTELVPWFAQRDAFLAAVGSDRYILNLAEMFTPIRHW
jgi:hypothetical protein